MEIQSILGKASQNVFMQFWNVFFVQFVLFFSFAFQTLYVSWSFPQLDDYRLHLGFPIKAKPMCLRLNLFS